MWLGPTCAKIKMLNLIYVQLDNHPRSPRDLTKTIERYIYFYYNRSTEDR